MTLDIVGAASSGGGGGSLAPFLPLILLGAGFYFIAIRPQQKRARAQQALLSSVAVGDEIITAGGIYGYVTDIDEEDTLTVEVADGVEIRMMRQGIARKVTTSADDDPDDGDDGFEDFDEDAENPIDAQADDALPDEPR